MIKLICDKCAEEVQGLHTEFDTEEIRDAHGVLLRLPYRGKYELCNKCYEQYKRLDLSISEYMEKPFDELNLLDNTFKVGDEVITADGRIGVIESICDCEHCKKRGFYEPEVKLTTGCDTIWITDTDKENGFKRFYKIGNQVYGNIDDGAFYNLRDRINECKKEISDSEAQLKVLKQLQEDKRIIEEYEEYCECTKKQDDDNWLDDIDDF